MNKGIIYIIITTIAFTTFEPISKLIATEINPLAITFLRFFIGGLILIPFALIEMKNKKIKVTPKEFLIMALLGILCVCISMITIQFAVLTTESPAFVAIIFSSSSVFTIIFAFFILKEKITLKKGIALIICVIGVISLVDLKSSTNIISTVLTVVSALTFSLYTILAKKTKLSGLIQTSFSFFFGSIFLLIILLIMKVDIISNVNITNIPHLLYLGIVVTGIGYSCYFKAMDYTSTLAVTTVFFIKPILSPFVTYFINGIVPNSQVFISLVLVLLGSYLSIRAENK